LEEKTVPIQSIVVRADILPRAELNQAQIEHYADIFDELPPIVVQKKTRVLIGGYHRLEAGLYAVRDTIRIVEKDVKDEDLADEALRDNIANGQPYTPADRKRNIAKALGRHPNDSNVAIAELCGVSEVTVRRYRDGLKTTSTSVEVQDEPNQNNSLNEPEYRVGKDNKVRAVKRVAPPVPGIVGSGGVSHPGYALIENFKNRLQDYTGEAVANGVREDELVHAKVVAELIWDWFGVEYIPALKARLGVGA
jgi:hypothetical protein